MYKCKKCSKEFEKYSSLSRHMSRSHDVNTEDFYVDYFLNGIHPTCKCGCGKNTRWSYLLKSFRDYCQGHQSRVCNNWGHNKKAIEASSKTRREQYASGERKVWNDGLTIEDERVRKCGKLRSKAYTHETRNEYSKRMRKNRLNGIIPTLRGKDHSQWKGGISDINVMVRSRVRLYKEWKYPILVRDEFKCVECGNSKDLHVHHDKEMMCDIIKKHIAGQNIDTFEMKDIISECVVEYHIKNKVSGVTLCKDCHNKLHPSLNFK